jgi:hypothetical protein
MRDKKRIKRICKLIEKIWNKYPDQRLGQLLSNYVFGRQIDIFFQEDNLTEENLEIKNG